MIDIPNFDYEALLASYDASSPEYDILTKMQSGSGRYTYDSKEVLEFEISLRKEITEASERLYRSGMFFEVFEKSVANPEFWIRTDNGGFALKEGVKGSAAIEDIFANGSMYATECATAMVIVYYGALLKLLGPERFDEIFRSIYLMNWDVREPLLWEVATPRPAAEHILGDRVYFNNPDVNPETPWWQGENAILLPGELYYGHGIGIHKAEDIIRVLNSQRKPEAETEAYLMETAGRPNFKKLYRAVSRPPATPVWREFPAPLAGVVRV